MNGARLVDLPSGDVARTSTASTLLKWRWRAYARVVGHAAARHAKTLSLVVGVFVFGLPLKAQLDLLSAPLTMMFTSSDMGFVNAGVLTGLSAVAVALVAVQAEVVFGGAARRWSTSLPGGGAAHWVADIIVTGTALWPFWLMLAAALVRHAIGGDHLASGIFVPVAIVLPVLWIATPLTLIARSRLAWAALVGGHAFAWLAVCMGGAWALWVVPAFACACSALALARLTETLDRANPGISALRSGEPLALAWTVLLNRYGHSLRLGALMLIAMAALCAWFVYTPDYASRSWGIVNFIVPFVVYQIATMHGWMRDEAEHQAGWFNSLPNAISRFKRHAAAIVIVLSLVCVLAFVLIFGFSSHAVTRYAGAFVWYAGLVLVQAACRWWGPLKSRLIDSLLAVIFAVACFCN